MNAVLLETSLHVGDNCVFREMLILPTGAMELNCITLTGASR